MSLRTTNSPPMARYLLLILFITCSFAFQSDELILDDDEFVRSPDPESTTRPLNPPPAARKRSVDSASDSDSKVQFSLEHAFGDSDFSPAGIFSARLKTSSHGGQTLTKLRFTRNDFSETDKQNFKKLLEGDDFYKVRLPSNVLNAPGREYVVSSVKARCLPRDKLDEHFVINTEGVNIISLNYGSPSSCQYPRNLKFPTKWIFKSHTVLKSTDIAPRTPVFTEVLSENGEGEEEKPPERSFWAKYWMYLIPVGLILMNAMTQAMNLPEEPGNGQPGSQVQQAAGAPRGQPAAVRRR